MNNKRQNGVTPFRLTPPLLLLKPADPQDWQADGQLALSSIVHVCLCVCVCVFMAKPTEYRLVRGPNGEAVGQFSQLLGVVSLAWPGQ